MYISEYGNMINNITDVEHRFLMELTIMKNSEMVTKEELALI